ncbi:MAG: hsdr protein probable type i restriction enzyme restrictionchain [Candidatus Shapirobacteria bacterium GW2011_GWE1_38_10]|uniref:Type I restriction enzyme endonuclease subunit n=1 Tax=Candidatus Shapirobacteria bacterium GW2011_GWE1_38_10 TaxID=1618488 RepID=A0A0G0I4L8_9BACT|nr:MAG: hsdr protein probable type i restriction enzyme restrictionchain [Candidatus Shapirobacteria bacterium GW2011_GWF2_37_20]KKQ50258.1 MAG: hsdr protein probable type i restriction enzyme restrictionchain [Candidatus Shapirobacteria bacterium GW2011_GWE1_38_10]KKQ64792.1 MAG: hsdr protein probable type i restriction enzyme restrictionchain [Candidatus Shapirobacteria bacterium GW2011_GWF1_38_23]HBP50807.1 deoxyribonuclease HsdR [Candidatus Shapirobacteria bacterium]
MPQSELQLEKELIEQLTTLGFEKVALPDNVTLETNLRSQLEKFNGIKLTDNEFARIINHLQKGDRFQKAKTLRDRYLLARDDESTVYIRFFNMDKWCKNEYQVTHQLTQAGKYENRYDVTLLINGLPLVQIELKRRGMEMKEAFNQIQRYHRHSFTGTLFEYIQIFVISNGVNTKYFSNNPKQSFEQTFFWTDEANQKITQLSEFADAFLEKCKVSSMIAEYIILAESLQIPMVLRPYQYFAVKAIEKKVRESNKNGYIWHTTGSGKTLTSYKASQILSQMPEIKKVLFVVDRKDLDIQTTKEFNSFSDGSVDGTDNTRNLVKQLKDPNRKLIVTTIQKLDIAISRASYLSQFQSLLDGKVVIIFDECHRSQFGLTHARITSAFKNAQLFGFTGTPIFADNNIGGVTTADVFGECLHKYIITHAIDDNNVLGFAVEYVGKYTQKDANTLDADIFAETLVEGIDTKEVLESDERLNKIADYVLADWKRKTKNGKFNALFATPNIEVLKKYYTLLKQKKTDDFKMATIFTYQANEDDSTDMLDVDIFAGEGTVGNQHSRDFLEGCISDYNALYGTNYSTERFYDYYRNLQQRIKDKEVDLVLVVNMFLTGFDSPRLNTLYVDKNLRYHGLIQAYSRTNRLLNSDKPHGNIISFRNLKLNTDKALALFGDENAKEIVFKKPYEEQKKDFKEKLTQLREKVPTVDSVDSLQGEEEKAVFVKTFRDLLRIKSSLETFAGFSFNDLDISEQEFYDYQSKYLDIHEERKNHDTDIESILDQIDFELELTVRDIIDFDYIIQLIIGLKDISSEIIRQKKTEDILKLFDRDVKLRKKKDLIRKFIEENLPKIDKGESVGNAFEEFWSSERSTALKEVAQSESIPLEKFQNVIGEYLYTQKLPHDQDIVDLLPESPRIMERQGIVDRIKNAIEKIIDIFEW